MYGEVYGVKDVTDGTPSVATDQPVFFGFATLQHSSGLACCAPCPSRNRYATTMLFIIIIYLVVYLLL